MSRDTVELMTPRILVVDDESQIHSSLRLHLAKDYEVICCFDAKEALKVIASLSFDLCFVDIHMPGMDGLTFIEAAQQGDPALGFVVLSAFDTNENLRKTVSLQVFDFVTKPFPERHDFESRIRGWVERTRRQRQEQKLAREAGTISRDLEQARQEREAEFVASETARDALRQTANLLTTIHAHLVTATSFLAPRARTDTGAAQLLRNLEVTRKAADAAMTVAEGFFDSAYGSRDSSPALIESGLNHAIQIARRMNLADETGKDVDFSAVDERLSVRGLSGIEFLLMMVPPIGAALRLTNANTTVRITIEHLKRLDAALKDPLLRSHLWINRKHALTSQTGVLITVTASASPLSRAAAESWIKGEEGPIASVAPRGLISGIRKSRGLLGVSVAPHGAHFALVLVLPT